MWIASGVLLGLLYWKERGQTHVEGRGAAAQYHQMSGTQATDKPSNFSHVAWQSVLLGFIDVLWGGRLRFTFLWPQSWECGLLSLKIAVCWKAQKQCPGMEGRCQHGEKGQISLFGRFLSTPLIWWVDVFPFYNTFYFQKGSCLFFFFNCSIFAIYLKDLFPWLFVLEHFLFVNI